jgi:hypothetical protein
MMANIMNKGAVFGVNGHWPRTEANMSAAAGKPRYVP